MAEIVRADGPRTHTHSQTHTLKQTLSNTGTVNVLKPSFHLLGICVFRFNISYLLRASGLFDALRWLCRFCYPSFVYTLIWKGRDRPLLRYNFLQRLQRAWINSRFDLHTPQHPSPRCLMANAHTGEKVLGAMWSCSLGLLLILHLFIAL